MEERQEAELEAMRKHAESKRKIKRRAEAEFEKILADETAKATRKEMQHHTETSRRIQSRAKLEFDQIIAQHTTSGNNDSRRGSLESVRFGENLEFIDKNLEKDLHYKVSNKDFLHSRHYSIRHFL